MSVRLERDYSQDPKNVKIAMNKSLLKEFHNDDERIVYLENGDEFQIQIFNDQTTEIGAKIYINGEQVGNSYLVINPGERVWLDRYLDKAVKFKFHTYSVNGNNEEVKRAIAKNGVVKVELYKKYTPVYLNLNYPSYPSYPQIYYCSSNDSIGNDILYSNSICEYDDGISGPTKLYSSSVNSASLSSLGASSTCTVNNAQYTTTAQYNSATTLDMKDINCDLGKPRSSKVETGRIQEGSHSDQEFDYVNMSFEYLPFDTETIHILPKSMKPVYSNDLQKMYCPNCGRKLKTKFNFCPFCGAKL